MFMRMFRNLTLAAAALTLSAPVFAAQAAPAAPAKATTTAPAKATAPATAAAKPAKAPKTTFITASGTVTKFDAASKTLTVTTPKGDVSFMVDSTASVMANGKKVMASDLPSHVGHKVVVRYTEANGQKMAQSVRVSMAAPKNASAKKTSATKKS
jgi:hypothetical protein